MRRISGRILWMAVIVAAGATVAAQDADRRGRFSWETRVTETAATYGVPDLAGTWVVTKRDNPVSEEICNRHTDARALPRNPCRFDASKLKLTRRAYAWLNFHDEVIEGKYHCVPESIPSLLARAYPVRFDQRFGRLVLEYQITIHNTATRIIFTDGRTHPDIGDTPSYYGSSIGRYEGNELVVDTRRFTFDPNGIDYMTNIPSSWRKRVVERYSRLSPDRMRMVLTIEDPEFLKEPYTETFELSRTDHQIIWTHCDGENALEDLKMIEPKYVD